MKYAIIEAGTVVNVVLWDGDVKNWKPAASQAAIALPDDSLVGAGHAYDGVAFIAPPAPAAPVPDPKSEAAAKIKELEAQYLLPRVVREYLLADFADKAAKVGIDPTKLPAYNKVKALDDQIALLRGQL